MIYINSSIYNQHRKTDTTTIFFLRFSLSIGSSTAGSKRRSAAQISISFSKFIRAARALALSL